MGYAVGIGAIVGYAAGMGATVAIMNKGFRPSELDISISLLWPITLPFFLAYRFVAARY